MMQSATTPRADTEATEQHVVRVLVRWQGTHWGAVIPDFTITGQGATPDAAARNAFEGLMLYLEDCARDGLSFEDARRPISWRWRLELRAQAILDRARHSRHPSEQLEIPLGANVAAC